MSDIDDIRGGISRRAMLLGTAGAAGLAMLPSWAFAADYPAPKQATWTARDLVEAARMIVESATGGTTPAGPLPDGPL